MDTQPPDTGRLFVPLRDAGCGVAVRMFRDRHGARCAVGFTSAERLVSALGTQQPYYRLTERALRELAHERGVETLVVDPGLVAAPVRDHVEPKPLVPSAVVPKPVAPRPIAPRPLPSRISALRSAFDAQTAGILAVSAVTGAATLAIQVLK
jgi:hypothetical protein